MLPTHAISVHIQAATEEQFDLAVGRMTLQLKALGPEYPHVSMDVTRIDALGVGEDEEGRELFHDDTTMEKVVRAILGQGYDEVQATDLINAMQNYGILFREIRP